MNRLTPFLLLVIIFTACNSSKEITSSSNDINECDTLTNKKINEYRLIYDGYWYSYQNNDNRDISYEYQYGRPIVAFNNNAYLYCQPDTNSVIKDTFNFNDLVSYKPIEHSYFNQGMHWYKVKDGNTIGYMRVADLCDPKRTYYIYDSKKRMRVGFELVTDSNGTREMVSVKMFNHETNEIISTSILGPYVSTFYFDITSYNPLDNDGIIYYRSSMQSCPGWTYEAYYTINNDSLVLLADGSSEGEGIYYDIDVVYLPTYYTYNKVALMPGGRDEGLNLDSFPYPKDIGVPIENLIVKFSEAADEDTSWFAPTDKVYEKVAAYEVEDEEDQVYLYVHKRDTLYYEYKDGKVLPIEYPKKK